MSMEKPAAMPVPTPAEEGEILGHMMAAVDPDNPQNFRLTTKIYASVVAWGAAFIV